MSFNEEKLTMWDKLKSSTANLHSSQEKAPKYKPTKDPLADPKKGLKSKLTLGSSESSSSKKKDAYYVEKDGDNVDSTVVHKALVKFYKNKKVKDPQGFEGFPSWLGYKEPEEEVVVQKEEVAPVQKVEKPVKKEEPVKTDPATLQSGYKPLSARPLFRNTQSSMRNLSINDTQRDFVGERTQTESESSGNTAKAAYSMRDRMKRK